CVWSLKNYEILLELVNDELKAKGYMIRLPDNLGKRRVEQNFYETTGIKYNTILTSRTGFRVNPLTGRLEMSESWWSDRIAEFGKNGNFV
ncbi:unnamed protein product, partial [Thlaspi arvense]